MRRIITLLVGLLVLAGVGFAAAVTMQPDTTHVERSLVIQATPADVFPLANDMKNTMKWSPWTELDPNQVMEFSDATEGVGAWYTWEGNDLVGKGRQEIVESVENTKVVTRLDFIEPWESTATGTIALAAEGEHTRVTWSLDTINDYTAKAFALLVDMEGEIAPAFEKGLAQLEPLAVAAAQARMEAEAAAEAEVLGAAEGAVEAAGGTEDP